MLIAGALFAVSTISGLASSKKQIKNNIATNKMNTRIQKINNSFVESTEIKNQIKQFQNFSEQHKQLAGAKNVALMSGGLSNKSSVFAGVKYDNQKEYYKAVQLFEDNIKQVEENKRRADINAEIGMNIANQNAMASYDGFNKIVNNAMQFYNYAQRETGTADIRQKAVEATAQGNKLSSVFGYDIPSFSALGGK